MEASDRKRLDAILGELANLREMPAADEQERGEIERRRDALRREAAQLGSGAPARAEWRRELDGLAQRLAGIDAKRINSVRQSFGDGTGGGFYAFHAERLNREMDRAAGRDAIVVRMDELRRLLGEDDQPSS